MDKSSALEYINQMFPTEASLSGVEPLMQKIHSEIRRVDAGILAAVRQQSNSRTKAKEDLAAATGAVEELMFKIREIKTKAEQSETMVQEICRDIKKLDFAKKHITTTITALHRLTMLVSAVEQLQVMASKRNYKEAAAQLEAVNQLCSHFEAYRDIPKIMELREKFKNIKQILKSHVFSDFSSLGTGKETEETNLLQQLSDACLVVDALEPSVREELVNNFCSRELTSYEQIFEGAELAKLDKTERRYAWIKRRIRTNEEIWKIFPLSWHVPYRLCIQFCKKTRKQLEGILENLKDKPDVGALLLALQRTLEFEDELAEKFGGGSQKEIGNEIEEIGRENNSQNFNFRGIISSCFEPHLTSYVELEQKTLMENLEKLVQEEKWDIEEGSQNNVLSSSMQMLLDTQAVKTILLEIPVLGRQMSSASSYSKFVSREMSKAEALLKVILSPVDSVADTYRALLPEGTPMEFQRILELKGLKKADQQTILDDFNKQSPPVSQPPILPSTSAPASAASATSLILNPSLGLSATSREDVLARAAALGRGAATTGFKRFLALTEAAKDRKDGPFRKLFHA
ncbi:Vacuolar protein sorting-associated protein 53 A [Linum perenne]